MKPSFSKIFKLLSLAVLFLGLSTTSAFAGNKKDFKLSWTVYIGNMPLLYAQEFGILDKWANKYGINIELVQINDYIEQINQYTAGEFDAALMTNMDSLTIPAASGIDTTIITIQDFSNGNDGIVLKAKEKLKDIKGQNVNLVELSVSHYLLARALDSVGLKEKDIKVVNTSDADIISAYMSKDLTSLVAWNPQLSQIKGLKDAHLVFDSSDIPGEIIDSIVVNSDILKDNPNFAKALAGAWYEAATIINNRNKEALDFIAKKSGTDINGINEQLNSTKLFFDAKEGLSFIQSKELINTMKRISEFSFEKGILGEGAYNAEFIGIEFPNKKYYGDKSNIKLRFDDTYTKQAAEGKL